MPSDELNFTTGAVMQPGGTPLVVPTGYDVCQEVTDTPYPDPNHPQLFLRDLLFAARNTGGVDARTTTTETISSASRGKLVTLSNASAIAATLSSTVDNKFLAAVYVIGAGTATLTPSSGQIRVNGALAANLALTTGQGAILYFDGTNWDALVIISNETDFYQTVQQAGTSKPQEVKLNFLAPVTVADNTGAGSSDVTVPVMVGDSGSGGTAGLAPAPGAGDAAANKYLKADGTFAALPSDTDYYQTVQQAGTSKPQEVKLNFLAPVTVADNSGAGSSDVTVPVMVGDSGSGGTAGLVPAAPSGSAAAGKFLKADGTFAVPPTGSGTLFGETVAISAGSTSGTLSHTPNPVSFLMGFRNGNLMLAGAGKDYTVSGTAITLGTAAVASDVFQFMYAY